MPNTLEIGVLVIVVNILSFGGAQGKVNQHIFYIGIGLRFVRGIVEALLWGVWGSLDGTNSLHIFFFLPGFFMDKVITFLHCRCTH